MATEMNVEAERAAFEAWASNIDHGYASFNGTRAPGNWYYFENDAQAAWAAWQASAARRAAQPADLGATLQELPTYYYDIDGSLRMKGREFEYGGTGEYVRAQDVREAIAADRERQKARIMHLTYERDKARDDLRAQLARQSHGDPNGWKLVPLKPTDDMIVAFAEQWYSKVRCIDDCEMEDCYGAMLVAAPSLPREQQLDNLDNARSDLANAALQAPPLSSEPQDSASPGHDGERYRLVRAQLSRRDFNYLELEGEPESEIDAYCDAELAKKGSSDD